MPTIVWSESWYNPLFRSLRRSSQTLVRTGTNIPLYAQYVLFRLTSQCTLPLRRRRRRHVYICPGYGVRRRETPQHDGYSALVLLDAVTHLSGGRGLSHPWLENTDYCHGSSWDPCAHRLLVRVSYGRCSGSPEQLWFIEASVSPIVWERERERERGGGGTGRREIKIDKDAVRDRQWQRQK